MKRYLKIFLLAYLFINLYACAAHQGNKNIISQTTHVEVEGGDIQSPKSTSEAGLMIPLTPSPDSFNPKSSSKINLVQDSYAFPPNQANVTLLPVQNFDGIPLRSDGRDSLSVQNQYSSTRDDYVTLNFNQTPIQDFILYFGKQIGINFILTPEIQGWSGNVTMYTEKPVPTSSLFNILESVLEVNGLTMIQSGHYVKIMPADNAKNYPVKLDTGKKSNVMDSEDVYMTHVVPLEHISAEDLANILKFFNGKGCSIFPATDLNLLIINGYHSYIKRVLDLVEVFDKPGYQKSEEIFVYYVEHGEADKLAQILNTVFSKKGSKKEASPPLSQQQQPLPGQPHTQTPQPSVSTPGVPLTPQQMGLSGEIVGNVSFVSDPSTNAIIIKTSPRNYATILSIIKKLDIMPKQVLIEVLIAEITLTDQTSLGIEWTLFNDKNSTHHSGGFTNNSPIMPSTDVALGSLGEMGSGLNYLVSRSDKFISLLTALSNEDRVNVLSSPHILASDNKPATIAVKDRFPVKKTTNVGESSTESYEYMDAGISLKVTPKISENGLVSMIVDQEVSDSKPTSNEEKPPNISTRNASTTMVVQDGHTLIIGGLIKNTKTRSRIGIPFLMNIPIFGYLFGGTNDIAVKTELIILITPHIIKDLDEAKTLSDQFQYRVRRLRSKMDKSSSAAEALKEKDDFQPILEGLKINNDKSQYNEKEEDAPIKPAKKDKPKKDSSKASDIPDSKSPIKDQVARTSTTTNQGSEAKDQLLLIPHNQNRYNETNYYTIQIKSFKEAEEAYNFIDDLKIKGYPAYVKVTKIENKGTWYRVRVGKYDKMEEAEEIGERLQKNENISYWITNTREKDLLEKDHIMDQDNNQVFLADLGDEVFDHTLVAESVRKTIIKPNPPVKVSEYLSDDKKDDQKKISHFEKEDQLESENSKPDNLKVKVDNPNYYIQLITFRYKTKAEKLSRKLKEKNYPVLINKIRVPNKGVRYRVGIGPFNELNDAIELGERLRIDEKLDYWIIKK
ncbi:MAG: SPOR domain-containing protein [bacterium]